MVKYTYTPSPFDFDQQTIALLKQIWNFNTHSDKAKCVDCLAREEWCIERVRQKWKPDFVLIRRLEKLEPETEVLLILIQLICGK